MSCLLDSCILIDVLRGRDAARQFVEALAERPAVSVVSITEIMAGVRDDNERMAIERLFAALRVLAFGEDEALLAGAFVRRWGRSHGVDPLDAMIAATAQTHGLAFATLNLKHFPMFPDLARPY